MDLRRTQHCDLVVNLKEGEDIGKIDELLSHQI